MKQRKRTFTVPPKISEVFRVINGVDTKIKIVRDSFICRLTTKKDFIIFGRTIYTRHKIFTKKMFELALDQLNGKR